MYILSMAIKERIHIMLCFACLLLLMGCSYSQTDTLRQQEGREIKELISNFGKFKLGIFGLPSTTNRYVGIWYNKGGDEPQNADIVWVANRNNPIKNASSGILKLDSTDGNLKFFPNDHGNPIAITSARPVSGTVNRSVTLQQSGNLVLSESMANGSIWQSFDYPTDTLLPGMKLGFNLQTGQQWFLKSWRARNNPAEGSFIFRLDPNVTNKLIISWLGEKSYYSLLWQNGRFNLSTSIGQENSYNFSYTSNERERYFVYSENEDVSNPKLRISYLGHLQDDVSSFISCPYSICGVEELPACRGDVVSLLNLSYKDDMFKSGFMYKHGFMSGDGMKFKENDDMILRDCELKCLNNCSCFAYALTDEENQNGCEIWSRGTRFIESNANNSRKIYMQVKPKEKKWWIWIIIAVAGVLVVILSCSLAYRVRRRYKGKEEKRWMSSIIAAGVVLLVPLFCYLCYLLGKRLKAKVRRIMNRRKLLRELGDNAFFPTTKNRGEAKEKDQNMSPEWRIFNFQTIAAATDNFSATNKLGEGGFGPVYKGDLLDGKEVAIKRLSNRSGQGITEFKNEAKLIAKLQHTNLVRLLGCSLQREERILVYEYMPNKSLDFFIFDSKRKRLLNWKTRLNIIEGIAQGLIYLHKYSRLKVIHRDLKASNILLDDQMNPKISDFGMARIFGVNESEANTNRVVGTYGYMSPEYAMSGIVSVKTDIFSFGVLVLEILSSKKNNNIYHTDPERPLNLVGYAWQLWNEGKALNLIDKTIDESSPPPNEVLRFIHVGLLCVQDQAADRPTTSDVVSMLSNETMFLPPPKQPAFFININSDEQEREVSKNRFEVAVAAVVVFRAIIMVPLFAIFWSLPDGEYRGKDPISHGEGKSEEMEDQSMSHQLKIYSFQTIAAATNYFSTTNKLGEGGCCLHGEERILVFEYIPNKSLDFFIFDSERKNMLNWKKHFQIIEGVAQGLLYLHKNSRLRVIVKASNILLDEQMNPRISDFGMTTIFDLNEVETNTNRVVETYSYMSPEHITGGIVSMKTDVFSFGVLVLEIVSGKKNNSCYNLLRHVWQLWNEGKALELIDGLELIDPTSDESRSVDEVLRCIHVGLLCVQDQASDRPSMSNVVCMLANENAVLPAPKQPSFYVNVSSEDSEFHEINLDSYSAQ
ncbi:hypothetical protein Ddye_014715 [Dipteronia dyeriana]|uniref:non-specific serine/threonine protein kinase n=1 Tax=Dipteronia dyeriana TaxID=168575 RepID=A0AAD9X8J8_9ROSI|nr:hypothetical protein Ddye_014715 [Dipteronia dyeriana]